MAKKSKNLGPRRKRMKREARLQSAKSWLKDFTGKNVVKSYAKWFGIDSICAMNELELLGLQFTVKQKRGIQQGYDDRIKRKQLLKDKKLKKEPELEEEYEGFGFVAGFTEGGAPFGLTYDEIEEIELRDIEREKMVKALTDHSLKWVDKQLVCEDGWLLSWIGDEEDLCCLEDCEECWIDYSNMSETQSAVERIAIDYPPSDQDIPAFHEYYKHGDVPYASVFTKK